MNLSAVEREEVATELRRFASDLNLTDDQKERLRSALTEAREKIAEYLQQHPNTTKADVISNVVAHRDAIRERVVSFLSPEQLKKWDAEKAKAKRLPRPEARGLRTPPVLLHLGGRQSTRRPPVLRKLKSISK
jgi:periplasmic protein CpxP/Spy